MADRQYTDRRRMDELLNRQRGVSHRSLVSSSGLFVKSDMLCDVKLLYTELYRSSDKKKGK